MATLALVTRQSLLIAYIALGMLLGPWGLALVKEPEMIQNVGNFGIIFLLFLLGLHLNPRNLLHLLRQTMAVTVLSATLFAMIGYMVAKVAHLSTNEAVIVGLSMMFSSTLLGLKLLPTTILHHQRTGEIIISVLLLQDIIAIFVLLGLQSIGSEQGFTWREMAKPIVGLPGLLIFAFLFEKYCLSKIIRRFNRIHEFIFLMAIAWCLGIGELAEKLHLSFEIGAFIAGISLATSPIARFIAESLKPLRDFFLILFFFSLGAGLDLPLLQAVLLPASLLATLMMTLKPIVFKCLLRHTQPSDALSWELGMRLGQISEFSLLVAYYAQELNLISELASYLIQTATIMTFIASSYIIVAHYPTPIATNDRLRRD